MTDAQEPGGTNLEPIPQYRITAPQTVTEGEPSPARVSPSEFKIGARVTPSPLVSASQLKTHLNLLRAFKLLRTRVEEDPRDFPVNAVYLTPGERWTWFLESAVERFQRWAGNLTFETVENFIAHELPPLDVLLVWHAYMLNPAWYSEDCERLVILKKLKKLNKSKFVLLDVLAEFGDLSTYQPSPDQLVRWLEATADLPWDPIASLSELVEQPVVCPVCGCSVGAPYLCHDPMYPGYAQKNFKSLCPICRSEITKEKLAVVKFARDIARDPSNIDHVKEFGFGVYLPGTLYTPTKVDNTTRGTMVKFFILRSTTFATTQNSQSDIALLKKRSPSKRHTDTKAWEEDIKQNVDYSMTNVRSHLSKQLEPPLVRRILSAYNDDRPFSVDLVGAVIRQGSFINKMFDLQWTQPGYFDSNEDGIVLHHCVARYHAFLDLISSVPTGFFVPTLDIDLGWHTHQLSPGRYAEDCRCYVNYFVNHDDKVEESHLSASFDETCRAWKERFGVPYMHCGCPLPGDTLSQKLSRLANIILHERRNTLNPPMRDDAFLATHPSDHNSVYVETVGPFRRRTREVKRQKHRARDLRKVRQGEVSERKYMLGERHEAAFLVPVPLYYDPVGYVGYPGACAAGVGGCVNGGTAGAGCGFSGCSACSGGGGIDGSVK